MRPILSPRARVRLRSPADVGSASCAEGTSVAATLLAFLRSLARGATATAVGAVVGWVVAFSSGPLVSPGSEKSGSFGLTARATVVWVAFAVRGFAVDAIIAGGRSSVLTSSFSSTTTLRWEGLDDAVVTAGGGWIGCAAALALLSRTVLGATFCFALLSREDFAVVSTLRLDGPACSSLTVGGLPSWATCVLE